MATTDQLHDRDAPFRALVRHSSDIIAVTDAQTRISFVSPSLARVLGWSPDEVTGTRLADLVHPEDTLRLVAAFDEVVETGEAVSAESRWRHRDGSWRHIHSVHANVLADADVRGIVLNARDVTAAKLVEEQLRHHALHDPLTDLPNRELFADRVEHALARTQRGTSRTAVLFIDLDDFKAINDTMGHAVGDQLLQVAGERLVACVRPGDTVARLHGDEFALLLEDIGDDMLREVASRVLAALRQPVVLAATELTPRASVGVAYDAGGFEDAETLLRNADVAMYMAKRGGKDRLATFEANMHEAIVERLDLKADLERGVSRGEFTVAYQPVVALDGEHLVGVEALARWDRPGHGVLLPGAFLALAEKTGLIVPIGRYVLQEACRQVAEWQRRHALGAAALSLSVNLSARQLREPSLIDDVVDALEAAAMDPASLVLEITETMLMVELDLTVATLEQLRRLGVRIAVDDFGTGPASLESLERLPIDMLKVDRSVVDRLSEDDATMIRATVAASHALGLDLVAEGIEQPEQLLQLQALGYRTGQGFIFAQPLDGDTFGRRLAEASRTGAWPASEVGSGARSGA